VNSDYQEQKSKARKPVLTKLLVTYKWLQNRKIYKRVMVKCVIMIDTSIERSKLEAILHRGSLYEIIGVPFNASDEDIQRTAKRMQVQNHPDRHMDLPLEERTAKEDLFKQATTARKVLGEYRDNYNAFIVARYLMPDSVLTDLSVGHLEGMMQKVDYRSLALQFMDQKTGVKPKTDAKKYQSVVEVAVQFYDYLNPRLTKYFFDAMFDGYRKQLDEAVVQSIDSVVRDSPVKLPSDIVRRIKNTYTQKLRKGLASKVIKSVTQQVSQLRPVFVSYAVYGACQQLDMKYDKVVDWARQQGCTYIRKISEKDVKKITSVLNAVKDIGF